MKTTAEKKSMMRFRDVVHVRASQGPFLISDLNVPAHDTGVLRSPGLDPEHAMASRFEVDHLQGAGKVIFPVEATGHVERHDARYGLDELMEQGFVGRLDGQRAALVLEVGDALVLECDGVEARLSREPVPVLASRLGTLGWLRDHMGLVVMLSGGVHLLLLALAFMIPAESYAVNLDAFELNDRFVKAPAVKPEQLPPTEALPGQDDQEDASESPDGKPQAVASAKPTKKPRRAWRPKAKVPVRDAGDVGILSAMSGNQRASLFEGDLNKAGSRMGAGNLHGGDQSAPGSAGGGPLAGLGVSEDFGIPGDGKGFKLGRRQMATVDRNRYKEHPGRLLDNDKEEVEVHGVIRPGPVSSTGNLDRGIIQRRIRSNMARFRYCYEKRLQGNPSLGGKLVVSFTIEASGRVVSARAVSSTLGDAQVEGCVVSGIHRLKFPSFTKGVVIVNYPFTFVRKGG